MENLADPLEFLCFLRLEISNGSSVRVAFQTSIQNFQGEFASRAMSWFQEFQKGEVTRNPKDSCSVAQLFHLVGLGIKGVPVAEPLKDLENHMVEICKEDVQQHIDRLPTLLCLPLVACFLPAFIILVTSPAIHMLQEGLESSL